MFSQWTSTLDVLEWLLQQLGLPFLRLDGSTAVAERLSLVDQCAPPRCGGPTAQGIGSRGLWLPSACFWSTSAPRPSCRCRTAQG